MRSIVVLGGYGNFGQRIVAALAGDSRCRVLVAGRNAQRAESVAKEARGNAEPFEVDCHSSRFAEKLVRANAGLVIHTAGPFQEQNYSVPRACIDAGAHYVDLADARGYVCNIRELDTAAKRNDVLVVSGASSLPALSSAIVDQLARQFASIESIEYGITSGARPPGQATMNGVLAYAGKSFTQWRQGRWQHAHGWQDIVLRQYPRPIGLRLLASCDVPDLQLFPERYAPVRTIVFRAGVAHHSSMLAIWLASWAIRLGWMKSLVPHVPRLHRLALERARSGSKYSAMYVTLRGHDAQSKPISRTWTLIAGNDHGPYIPCFPAIALARKLMGNEISARGAMPCVGLLTVEEILNVGRALDIRVVERAVAV
jgi:short subunit dehydrogenase-like uncharacterized protein